MKQSYVMAVLAYVAQLSLVLLLGACSERSQDANSDVSASNATRVLAPAAAVEQGLFFKPELDGYALHNEYDDDGDGDGINETHVRRYIDQRGDTVFSMTTNGQLWAWSLDSKDGDNADTRLNFVIRDSNCDGVFDERYSLTAQFHVPGCLVQGGAAQQSGI